MCICTSPQAVQWMLTEDPTAMLFYKHIMRTYGRVKIWRSVTGRLHGRMAT